MQHITGFLCALVCFFRPTRGAHTSPVGYARTMTISPPFRRPTRVRPYAPPIPITEPPPVYEVAPRAAMVRPYVLDTRHRAQRAEECRPGVDQQRRGPVVVTGLGHPAPMWHCPVSGCQMAAPKPVTHPCPLTGTTPNITQPVLQGAR